MRDRRMRYLISCTIFAMPNACNAVATATIKPNAQTGASGHQSSRPNSVSISIDTPNSSAAVRNWSERRPVIFSPWWMTSPGRQLDGRAGRNRRSSPLAAISAQHSAR